jgi:hypothetical protein
MDATLLSNLVNKPLEEFEAMDVDTNDYNVTSLGPCIGIIKSAKDHFQELKAKEITLTASLTSIKKHMEENKL